MRGIWLRSIFIVVFCGFAFPALIERDLPDGSPTWWAIYIAGLVVIAVGCALVQIRLRRRDAERVATESTGDAEPG